MKQKKLLSLIILIIYLSGCVVGPNYSRPPAVTPTKFKEAPKGWKVAEPNDTFCRGEWWKIFNDPDLNALECRLNITNQNIAVAFHQYMQARAIVDQARASFFPTVTASLSIIRQFQQSGNSKSGVFSPGTSTGGTVISRSSSTTFTSENLTLNGTWEPDLWGALGRQLEANVAAAQASDANLALVRLSSQASLAQYYFELRGVDKDQQLLDATVVAYKKMLEIVKNQYASGTASQADIAQAQTQLENAQALAINNGVNRALYEHAIAALIGIPASCFMLTFHPLNAYPPKIPLKLPCELLERRPDVANAERLVAQANAQIGVAIAAFFPVVNILTSASASGIGSIGQWLSEPLTAWSLGAQAIDTILDPGLKVATVHASQSNYCATVANYRQIVISAFQDAEDNLASIRILQKQWIVEQQAVASARLALKLVINQYKAGTVPYSSILTAENALFAAEKNANDVMYLRMTSAVGLIKSLGGGWTECCIDSTCKYV